MPQKRASTNAIDFFPPEAGAKGDLEGLRYAAYSQPPPIEILSAKFFSPSKISPISRDASKNRHYHLRCEFLPHISVIVNFIPYNFSKNKKNWLKRFCNFFLVTISPQIWDKQTLDVLRFSSQPFAPKFGDRQLIILFGQFFGVSRRFDFSQVFHP